MFCDGLSEIDRHSLLTSGQVGKQPTQRLGLGEHFARQVAHRLCLSLLALVVIERLVDRIIPRHFADEEADAACRLLR